uniref:Uncharacterized protein n=1 Tax=Zea mays TaxID=4577 RepID=B8A0A9_MAIZE|nr:unknown [Zea mays]ACN33284.1 unknown [Zea mays]ACN35826.1 unknown [Zea mays]ACN36074.1 unknown [Zea mays]ACN36262.1 unknown [Zea mays]
MAVRPQHWHTYVRTGSSIEAVTSRGAIDARLGDSGAGVDEVAVDEVGGEDLQLVAEALGEGLGDEEPRVAVDPLRDGPHAQHRVVGLGRHRVLHPVEEPPAGHRRLLPQELEVALELGLRQVRVDPVVLEVAGAPQRVPGPGRRRLAGLPDADDPPREQLRDGPVEHRLVLRDQVLAQLVGQEPVEPRRVLVPELGADLQDDQLGLGLAQEPAHVVQHHVHGVRRQDAVADPALLLHAHVDDARAHGQLLVHGHGLALREGAGHQRHADLVGGRVVRAGPHHLVHAQLVGAQLRHPPLPVRRPVLRPRERVAGGGQPRGQRPLLGGHQLPPVHLLREEGAHGFQRVAAAVGIGGSHGWINYKGSPVPRAQTWTWTSL